MNIYAIPIDDAQGLATTLAPWRGQVLLIVNTATGCGFTPQYAGLQKLYDDYRDRGFAVLDFPCNQFGGQAPGTAEEIDTFCTLNYATTFPRFAKVKVNGKEASPLFEHLKKEQPGTLGGRIKWNFTKFLVDRAGNVVGRYAPQDKPENIAKDIEALL
ncbi:MAG: glutathione peroxidase [Clostridiales bacterium]|nr:glutathione peroxidase [Clostridiales bacterium]